MKRIKFNIFRERKSDSKKTMKALYFDRDGFVLLQKRLDNGKFQWPRNSSEVRPLTRQEFRWLMEGFSID